MPSTTPTAAERAAYHQAYSGIERRNGYHQIRVGRVFVLLHARGTDLRVVGRFPYGDTTESRRAALAALMARYEELNEIQSMVAGGQP